MDITARYAPRQSVERMPPHRVERAAAPVLRHQRGLPLPRARRSPSSCSPGSTSSASPGCGSPRPALIFALWRRPWRTFARLDRDGRRLLVAWGVVLAVDERLLLHRHRPAAARHRRGDRVPPGDRPRRPRRPDARNAGALLLAVAGVYLLTDVQLVAQPLGHRVRVRQRGRCSPPTSSWPTARPATSTMGGIDGLGAAMLIALVASRRSAAGRPLPAFTDAIALLAGVGVGVSLVGDPLRDRPARDAPPAAAHLRADGLAAAGHGDRHRPAGPRPGSRHPAELVGVAGVIAAIAIHREPSAAPVEPDAEAIAA